MSAKSNETIEIMAGTARDRARMWQLCGEILERPTQEFVDRLRSDSLAPQVREATAWLGDEFEAKDVIGALSAFARRSDRFSAEHDLKELGAEWEKWIHDPEISDFVAQSVIQARTPAGAFAV